MNKKLKINKKAQVSDAVTWVVSTLIIVLIISISIAVSFSLGGDKTFRYSHESDLFAKKSLTSYLLTEGDSGGIIFEELKNEGNFEDFNGELALGIFREFYKSHYDNGAYLWVSEGNLNSYNPFFGRYAEDALGVSLGTTGFQSVRELYDIESSVFETMNIEGSRGITLFLLNE